MNRPGLQLPLFCALLVCSGAAAAITPATPPAATPSNTATADTAPPLADATVDRLLAAMHNASTWGHPDLFGEFSGFRLYSQGHYKQAIHYFKYGARYADKLSQLSIGLMYASGRGVAKDPATACAWLTLAAERKYPSFVATRDRVCATLSAAGHQRTVTVLNGLVPEYGDKVAKPRMALALRLAQMQMTGSRLGFDYGVNNTSIALLGGKTPEHPAYCGGPSVVSVVGAPVPQMGCGGMNYWTAVRWDPKQYFAARDARWRGVVTVGAAQRQNHAAGGNKPDDPS